MHVLIQMPPNLSRTNSKEVNNLELYRIKAFEERNKKYIGNSFDIELTLSIYLLF